MKARDLILAAGAETGHPVKPRSNEKERWENDEGQLHRDNGPAVEYKDGTRVWWQSDQLHRNGGPAVEHASGYRAWYQNDQRHRDDGPAIEYADGTRMWHLNGRFVAQNADPDYQAVLAANGFPPDVS